MLRAVPATMLMALSMVKQFRSGILSWAIALTWSQLMLPTFLLCGSPLPPLILAASLICTAAGGVLINDSNAGGGVTTMTGFANNTVSGNTVGSGIAVTNAVFDSVAGGAYQQVSGGTTTVGASGNGVGATGVVLTTISGDLSFTDLDIFASAGAGLRTVSTGVFNAGTGELMYLSDDAAIFGKKEGFIEEDLKALERAR